MQPFRRCDKEEIVAPADVAVARVVGTAAIGIAAGQISLRGGPVFVGRIVVRVSRTGAHV